MTTNKHVLTWLDEMVALVKPDKVVWIDGSEEQLTALREESFKTGEMVPLNEELLPGCVLHHTAVNDVARVEGRTYICTKKREDAAPINNWMETSEMKAKLVGTDPRSDVALLKIEGKNLPVLKLGKSQDLKAGQWVVAIGSPFGFDHTVTQGIISAMGRSLPNESYVPFIQTDVPINPGNSGGPLFNLAGEVVGINSQIYTRSGGFMGVSFAIPIDVAMDVSNQLKSGGKVSRGWLGVVIQEVNKDLAESFGLEKPAGALVAQVLEDGPAAKGGLQVGDVILSMNGQPIVMSADLPHLVGALKAGSKASLEVVRDGKRKTLDLTVGAIPDEGKEMDSPSGAERSSNRLGVSVADLSDEQKKTNDIKGGVIIKDVQDGPAALIGLRPGDVITHLNNQAISDAKQFTEIAKALPKNRSVSMRVLRQGRASFITFKLAE